MSVSASVEAILLVSGRPVSAKTLAEVIETSEEEIEAAVTLLKERYEADSGITVRRVSGGFQMATNPKYAEVIERFRQEARPSPLSAAANEVLSSVLYLGPMTRAAVSRVRGVNSDAVVRSLIERNLLTETGYDSESAGSPAIIDVTEEFFVATGSNRRDDFPPLESLVSEEELQRVRERVVSGGRGESSDVDEDEEEGREV